MVATIVDLYQPSIINMTKVEIVCAGLATRYSSNISVYKTSPLYLYSEASRGLVHTSSNFLPLAKSFPFKPKAVPLPRFGKNLWGKKGARLLF